MRAQGHVALVLDDVDLLAAKRVREVLALEDLGAGRDGELVGDEGDGIGDVVIGRAVAAAPIAVEGPGVRDDEAPVPRAGVGDRLVAGRPAGSGAAAAHEERGRGHSEEEGSVAFRRDRGAHEIGV